MNVWVRLSYVFIGPVSLAGAALAHGRTQIVLFILGCLATLLGFWLAELNLSHAAKQHVLDAAVNFLHASGVRNVRANYMRLGRGGTLRMQYLSTAYRDFERSQPWKRGDGSCASTALEQRITVLGGHDGELPGPRNVDFPVRILTMKMLGGEEIKSVLSVPVYQRNGREVAGVINFDDVLPLNRSKLASPDILRAARDLGTVFLQAH